MRKKFEKTKKPTPVTSEEVVTLLEALGEGLYFADQIWELWTRRKMYLLDPEEQAYWDKKKERADFQKRLFYLKRKGKIKAQKIEGKMLITLDKASLMHPSKVRKLDAGTYCLVAYDIPVDANSGRDAFRYFLKRKGFTALQRSLWMTEYDYFDELKALVKRLGIDEWVKVFLVRNFST